MEKLENMMNWKTELPVTTTVPHMSAGSQLVPYTDHGPILVQQCP